MKRIILLIVVCTLNKVSLPQSLIGERNDLIKDKAVYLFYAPASTKNEVKYSTTGDPAGAQPLNAIHTFDLKGNYTNVHIEWLNPLKYSITWKDTTSIDDRDKVINDFVKLFVGQFGSPLVELNTTTMLETIAPLVITEGDESKIRLYGVKDEDKFNGFNNLDLMELYLYMRASEDRLKSEEIIQLNSILKELDFLDNLSSSKLSDEVNEQFLSLYNVSKSSEVIDKTTLAREKIESWNITIGKINTSKTKIDGLIVDLQTALDELFLLYTKKVVLNFLSEVNENHNSIQIIIDKFKPCVDIIDNSVKNKIKEPGYFLNRSVSFTDGKVLETEITITELEYNKTSNEFTKKSIVYNSKIKFRKYDWVVPVVSAGIFYSDATLKGFGVSTDSTGTMTVTEDNINSNTAVTALFLNLNFDIGSRYIAPALQLGIDPTKKRPYMLLGGGFSIPAAKIALTGGWIWTWDAYLDGLQVGQSIKSTTELDKITKYKFDAKTKGYYLGIQYNF